jgi:hypothetical protein
VRDRTIFGQGKALTAANAEAVDSLKTLIESTARGEGRPGRHAMGGIEDARIRISDERSQRREELLLGRYRLIERLGAGGFGVVWHAHDEQLDRAVALKRIPLPSEEDRERATREALATARLSHPAIVALYEASADEEAFYLISELVGGDTLALLIAEDRLSDEDVLEIGVALTEALEHAHARGVIHRDVKPHNVLVPHEDTARPVAGRSPSHAVAKLADFGGARLAGEDALTRPGDVFGTLAYMAPEQSEGEEVGTAADLYSLGLVLYEALSGVNPVRGRTPAATARRIGAPIESLACRRRDLPRELTHALDSVLACDPELRGTLSDLHEALADTLQRGTRRRLFARAPAAQAQTAIQVAGAPHAPHRTVGSTDEDIDPLLPAEESRRRFALPRLLWLGCVLSVAIWQAMQGRTGVSLLMLAAGAPLLVLPRRSGPGWLAALLAPVLGLAGLAGAFPALAGQRADWRARVGLALLGFWWLALAEPLLAKHLWLGPPGGMPPRVVWEASFDTTSKHVVGPMLTVQLLIGAATWALAAAVLPWIVRGRSAALDVLAAVAWTIALLLAVPLLDRALLSHASYPSPRGALLGAVLGCALAVCARALRGPT